MQKRDSFYTLRCRTHVDS